MLPAPVLRTFKIIISYTFLFQITRMDLYFPFQLLCAYCQLSTFFPHSLDLIDKLLGITQIHLILSTWNFFMQNIATQIWSHCEVEGINLWD